MICVRKWFLLAKPCFERVVRILFFPGLTHREPLLDEGDFQRFVTTVDPLMKAGRDVMWVLVGRTESSLPKVKKVLAEFKMTVKALYLCYTRNRCISTGIGRGSGALQIRRASS